MKYTPPDQVSVDNPPSLEEFRALVNEVFNVDTSSIATSQSPAADGSSAKESEMAEEAEMVAAGEAVAPEPVESAEASEGKMTLADLAEATGMSEEDLMARMKELEIGDETSIEGILEAISADEALFRQLVDLLKNAGNAEASAEEAGGIM